MDGRYSHPYQNGGGGGGGQSSASFASSSKLRPPTYLAQAPTFPRQSSGSLRRSVIGDTSIDSLPRQSISSSNISHNDTHHSSNRRRGRKSAFDTFDELGFCNDLASKIANELAARPSRNPRRSVPIDPWRGTIPGSTPQANADDTTQNGIEGQEQEDDDSDDEEDSDSDSEDGDEDEDEEQEEGENVLDAERTERTRLAAEAFLQRLAERGPNGDIDESEKGLEKQVFEVFGGNSEGQEIRSSTDQLEQEDVSPEVAMQVAQMLQKSTTQNEPGQKPLIEEVDEQEHQSDTEQNELLADSSIEYDQLKTISSEAARNRDEEVEDESDNDSLSGEAEIEGEEEEDDDEDDESEGVEEDYYDEQQQHQYLYTQPSRSGSMGIYGSNQEDAISLIDSDEEDEIPTNSQPANYNRMAHDAAQYEKYQDGSDDEQEVDEEEVEDVEGEDDEMDDKDEGEGDAHNEMEMLEEGDHNVPADDAALFQNNQQVPPFDPAFAASMPADPSNLWQNSIQQSIQVLNELTQAQPAVFDQNLSSDQPSFPSSLPQAAFSPNLFEQAFPTSSESIDNQAVSQLTPHNSTWSSFPVPPSPAPLPPPPAEAEAIGMADGEALLQLKAQVNEQVEEDQQRSHRTSLSPVPPSTVMTTQANQSTASTPKPTAGHVKDGKDLVDLKNVVKRAAALRSQRTSVASDIGTPRNDLPTPGAVQPIVEEDEPLSQQFQPPNPDQDLGQEIEITEVRSTAGDQAVEHLLIQPDVESVTSLIHEHVPETQDESSRDLHIREVLMDTDDNGAKDTEDTVAGIIEVEGSGLPLDAPEVQAGVNESEEPQHEDLQDPIEPVEGTLENVDAVNTLDAVLEQVKEDLDAAVKDEGLEETMEMDQTVPEIEVNVEAPTADENLEANGLVKEAEEAIATPIATEDMVTEEQERKEEPVIMDQKAEEILAQQLQVPEDVSMQEAEKLSTDQDEIEVAADSSTKVAPRRSGRKRGSVSESIVEHNAADEDVQAPESRRETRSSTKRAASEALSTKSGHEADHNHPMQSSPHSHRKPRRSDPDGDLADYVPEDVRRKRMRSRTRSPSVARETVVPTSIGIPDKLLDTSILEEDEEEEEQQVASPTPAKGKRGRKPKKEIEAAEQSTKESSSNPLENELQSGKTNSPRKKTEEEKKIYKRQRKKDYDDRRKKSTKNTKGTDSSSAMGVGEEGQNIESQNSKDGPEPEVEKEVEAEAELPKESVQPEPTPAMRVTRRSTRQRTEEQEAESSQSQGADQSMNDDDAETEQQDKEKGEAKRTLRQSGRRRGRGKK